MDAVQGPHPCRPQGPPGYHGDLEISAIPRTSKNKKYMNPSCCCPIGCPPDDAGGVHPHAWATGSPLAELGFRGQERVFHGAEGVWGFAVTGAGG